MAFLYMGLAVHLLEEGCTFPASYPPTPHLIASTGAILCYTTNGTTPATNGSTGCTTGTLYSAAVSVAASETLKAVAGGTGFLDSSVSSAAYTINGAAIPPSAFSGVSSFSGSSSIH